MRTTEQISLVARLRAEAPERAVDLALSLVARAEDAGVGADGPGDGDAAG